MSETFVDATSRGVELGRRMHLTEIGPTGAYLEHPVPMPVGSELRISTDEGLELGVVVVRVCEQVGGAERTPGMFVRVVELSSRAEVWWNEHKTIEDDPAFPEPARVMPTEQRPTMRLDPAEIAAVTHEGLQRPAALDQSESEVLGEGEVTEQDLTDPEAEAALAAAEAEAKQASGDGEQDDGDGSNGAGSTLQGISVAAALAAAADDRSVPNVRSTIRMTPDQIKSITDTAAAEAAAGNKDDGESEPAETKASDAEGDGDEKPKGKRRKRRRKKRKTNSDS